MLCYAMLCYDTLCYVTLCYDYDTTWYDTTCIYIYIYTHNIYIYIYAYRYIYIYIYIDIGLLHDNTHSIHDDILCNIVRLLLQYHQLWFPNKIELQTQDKESQFTPLAIYVVLNMQLWFAWSHSWWTYNQMPIRTMVYI